jgi:hypothetical protein
VRGFIESSEGRLSTNCFRVFVAKLGAQYLHSLTQCLDSTELPGSTQRLTEPLTGYGNIPTRGCKTAEDGYRLVQ